jgi:uncharacterized membrane protein YozB (DUF420 family)
MNRSLSVEIPPIHWGYSLHIGINIVGILLLTIGTLIAIFRGSIQEGWYQWHRGFQMTSITLLTISVLLGLWLRAYAPRPDAQENWWHGTIGVLLLILLVGQLALAVVIKPHLSKETFSWGHRVLAIFIWILVFYQIYLGWKIVRTD